MFTNRLFKLMVASVAVVIIALAVQQVFVTKAIVSDTKSVYTESKEQTLREAQLGERYGEVPQNADLFSAEQISREYSRGERYGQRP